MKKLLLTMFTVICLSTLLLACAATDSNLDSDVKTDSLTIENTNTSSNLDDFTISPATTKANMDIELEAEVETDTISESSIKSTTISQASVDLNVTAIISKPETIEVVSPSSVLIEGDDLEISKDEDTDLLEEEEKEEDLTLFVSFDQEVTTDLIANYTIETDDLTIATETDDTVTLTLEVSDLTPYDEDYTYDSSEITSASYLKSEGSDYNFDKSLHTIETDYDGDLSIFKDFKNLQKLVLYERANLSGIENCPQIKILLLQMNPYSDENDGLFKVLIVNLDDISHIKELTIYGYSDGNYVKFIESTSPVELKKLELCRSYFRNINAFNNSADLYFLALQHCSIDKPFILSSFKNMRSIQSNGMAVERNKFISNFDENFVEGLTNLTYLYWENTNIGPANGLSELKDLTNLHLSGFSFDDYDVVASNPKLDTFHIENSEINNLIIRDSGYLRSIGISNLSLSGLKYRNNKDVNAINIDNSIIEKTSGYDEMSPYLNISNVDFLETDKATIKTELKGMTINNMQFDFSMSYELVNQILESNDIISDKIEITNYPSDCDYGHSIIENENFNLFFNTDNELCKITINSNIENSTGNFVASSIGSIISTQGDDYKRYSTTNELETVFDFYYGDSSLYFVVESGRVKHFSVSMYHYDGILNE